MTTEPSRPAPGGARRGTRRRPLAAGLLLLAAAAPVADVRADPGPASGLPWASGSTKGGECLVALRDRPHDVLVNFVTHKSFQAMVNQTGQQTFKDTGAAAPLWVVSLPLLTDDTKGQFAQCAAGAFDGSFRQIGANLKAAGTQGVVVRLGWEANIGSKSHPWGVDSPDQVPSYVQCWRHAALALKAGGPGLNIEWTNAKKTANTALRVLDMYPGDDVVDLWGVHYYDGGPLKSTQATWDKFYMATFNGGPWGLGTWLAAAKAHGKKLGWASTGSCSRATRPRRRPTTRCTSPTCTGSSGRTRPRSRTRATSTRTRTRRATRCATRTARRRTTRTRPRPTRPTGGSASRPPRAGCRV
jgi:hypothetical protein